MSEALAWAIALPAAYLLGSVPTGILVGKLFRGVDVRKYGSGNTGATNILRTLGPLPAVLVLALDWGKGAASVFVARAAVTTPDSPVLSATCALIVVVGHSWPIFAGFKGGKGVATGLGALFIISPIAGALTMVGLVVAAITRYVSLGSIVGTAIGLASLVGLIALDRLDIAYLIFAVGGFLIIEVRHKANLERLMKGTESKLFATPRPKRSRPK